jgi:hypothetical protein
MSTKKASASRKERRWHTTNVNGCTPEVGKIVQPETLAVDESVAEIIESRHSRCLFYECLEKASASL